MRWMVHLDGGPRRVNHAAVALSPTQIYSFGGYCSGGIDGEPSPLTVAASSSPNNRRQPIDVHVLNTATLRWRRMPPASQVQQQKQLAKKKNSRQQNAVTSGRTLSLPLSTSFSGEQRQLRDRASTMAPSSSNQLLQVPGPSLAFGPVSRGRARSVAELHPLSQLRLFRPPLADGELKGDLMGEAAADDLEAMERSEENGGMEVEEEAMDPLHSEEGPMRLMASLAFHSMSVMQDEEEEDEDVDIRDVGGIAAADHQQFLNYDLNGYEGEDGEGSERFASNPVPYQRYGHTVVAYKGKVYLWGGRNDELGSSSLLHEYDPDTNCWSIVPVAGSTVPPARDGHTACIYGDTMVVFGGYEERQHRFSQECYTFSFTTREWAMLSYSGTSSSLLTYSSASATPTPPPQYRDFHTAVVIGSRMYVFGGRCDEMGQIHSGQDVYCSRLKALDLVRREWIDLTSTMKGDTPTGRRSHSAWTHAGKMYIFGGYHSTSDRHFNDLYEYCPSRNEWRLLTPSGCGPAPRRRQCTVAIGDRVYLFGGTMPYPAMRTQSDSHLGCGRQCGAGGVGGQVLSPLSIGYGTGDGRLLDMADLYVLDYAPTLASLCVQVVAASSRRCGKLRGKRARKGGKLGVLEPRQCFTRREAKNLLPALLWAEVEAVSTPNAISKPLFSVMCEQEEETDGENDDYEDEDDLVEEEEEDNDGNNTTAEVARLDCNNG